VGLGRGCCRVPPRRAGNFLLRRQKKVTKEEALNAIRIPLKSPLALLGPCTASKRAAALSRPACHERQGFDLLAA
jgi:hypothetical protein